MKKSKLLLSAIVLSVFGLIPNLTNAWNYTGHVLIAQIAYDNLNPEAKKKADELSLLIFNNLPESQQDKLNKQYSNASTFAKVAILPDVWRKWKVSTLFKKFNALPPLNLFLSLEEPTANWHFIDQAYPAFKNCNTVESSNVVWAINKLENNLSKTKTENSKALQMVLLEHYIGDIHQPLHNMTNVKNGCEGDRGGNNFCLRQNQSGKCIKNLHSLWDSAVGYLKPHENIKQLAYELENLYPESQFTNQFKKTEVNQWANENYANAAFVYNTQEFTKPNPEYFQNGQMIAKSQLALAGYRLAQELNKSL